MGLLDTIIHEKNGLLAEVGEEIRVEKLVAGAEYGFQPGTVFNFDPPKVIDYRADVKDIAKHLDRLMMDEALRKKMGEEGRKRAVEVFDYRIVARQFVEIIKKKGLADG
jgi:glycosyltransferase involved in cell wall biosynthesis